MRNLKVDGLSITNNYTYLYPLLRISVFRSIKNDKNWSKLVKIGQNWSKNDQKWSKMIKNGHKL